MPVKMWLKVLILFFVTCLTNAAEESLSNELPQIQPRTLTYLGNVGSKQFFVANSLETWQSAQSTCYSSGLQLVQIKNEAEHAFIVQHLATSGPFWLGARDIGRKSMFRWSGFSAPTNPDDPDTFIGDFLYYYNYVEQGPLALQMNYAVGNAIFGAHSLGQTGKAFCQTG